MRAEGIKSIAKNRKARFDYEIVESIECGIVLEGTEVKSFRAGAISFPDAFCEIFDGQLWLKNVNVAEYERGGVFGHDPMRHKKLLAHKAELSRLERRVREKGFTLVPLEFYLKNGLVKVAVGLCRGKKLFDKRSAIRERDIDRELSRELKNRQK